MAGGGDKQNKAVVIGDNAKFMNEFVDTLRGISAEQWADIIEGMIKNGGIIPAFMWRDEKMNKAVWECWNKQGKAKEIWELLNKKR